MDCRSLKPGQNFDFEIKRALDKATFVLMFISKLSYDRRGYIQREIKLALDKLNEKLIDDIYIVPVLLDDAEVPDQLKGIQYISANDPKCQEQILDALQHQLERLGIKQLEAQEKEQNHWTDDVVSVKKKQLGKQNGIIILSILVVLILVQLVLLYHSWRFSILGAIAFIIFFSFIYFYFAPSKYKLNRWGIGIIGLVLILASFSLWFTKYRIRPYEPVKNEAERLKTEEFLNESLKKFEEASELAKLNGYQEEVVDCECNIGELYNLIGKYNLAIDKLTSCKALSGGIPSKRHLAKASFELGKSTYELRNKGISINSIKDAETIYSELSDDIGKANVVLSLGKWDWVENDLDSAKRKIENALETCKDKDIICETDANIHLAMIAAQSDPNIGDKATIEILEKIIGKLSPNPKGNKRLLGRTLLTYGNILATTGKYIEAKHKYSEAIVYFDNSQYSSGIARTLVDIAESERNLNNPDVALDSYERALKIFKDLEDSYGEATTLLDLGLLEISLGKINCAEGTENCATKSLLHANRIIPDYNLSTKARSFEYLGILHQQKCENELAREYFETALNLYHHPLEKGYMYFFWRS